MGKFGTDIKPDNPDGPTGVLRSTGPAMAEYPGKRSSLHLFRDSLRALTEDILRTEVRRIGALGYDQDSGWSIQGFGMLRKYLAGGKFRLHVWDSRYRVPNVTLLHDHPWDFDSLVIAGQVEQYRYRKGEHWGDRDTAIPLMEQAIVCGPGGGVCEPPSPTWLVRGPLEIIPAGTTYTQKACEIHESLPLDGTVTLIERTFHENTEVAHVYYEEKAGWVTAEPREARAYEAYYTLTRSLRAYFESTPERVLLDLDEEAPC